MTTSQASLPALHLDPAVRDLRPSATLAIHERSARRIARGQQVFRLGFGQSPFPVPPSVVDALRRHAPEKAYLPVRGLPALRDAVARHASRTSAIACDTDDVLIGPGSKELMFLLLTALDADVLIPSPSWVSYAPQAAIVGRRVHWLDTDPGNGWRLAPETLAATCEAHPGRRFLLILNTPSNPTGAAYDAHQLTGLAEVARRHGVIVLSDEIYGVLHHHGAHTSIATDYPEGTVVTSGLSKWCGAGGWRLGTMIVPPPLHALRDAVAALASETFSCVAAPIQHAAIEAFAGGPAIDAYVDASRRLLGALGRQVAGRLRAAGVHTEDPDGGFYLFPDFRPLTETLRARGIDSGADLCAHLLDDSGVALLPGVEFGRPHDEPTARLAFVDFDGTAALEAVRAHGEEALDDTFLGRWCGPTTEGVERLCGWLER